MTAKTPPWKKKTPHKGSETKLTDAQIKEARARAKKAGRPYPNLVDNMAVAKAAKKEKGRARSRTEDSFPTSKDYDE